MAAVRSLKDVFNEALERDAAERAAFIVDACGEDNDLRSKVQRLLAAHERGTQFLISPTGGPAAGGASPLREGPGSRIGPYELLEQIGEGGFGVVFLAQQHAPVVRRVALKVIKAGMDTREVIARFEAERQALAMMDHPSIARVFDAGTTDTGRPYFVMELVRGETITAYCHRSVLSIRQRLELVQQVCHGVQHAHQKGIIHRDLKPSNILVVEVDGRPSARIIDFGIAKAMGDSGAQASEETRFTAVHQMIGTPEYMSPEQAGAGAGDIDTRSDIYALGVLLYEMLTGAPPFDPKRLRSAPWEEMRRIIREDEPPRPSTRASQVRAEGTPSDSPRESRSAEERSLYAALRGDLDWIVMKCLEKDRARRYETANGLAMDIQRHLDGEPISAAPPGKAYRMRKFVRRHRAKLIAASLVVAALIAAIVGTTTFALREARQRRLAEQVAEFHASVLSDIDATHMGKGLREDILKQADDKWRRSRSLTAEEIAGRSAEMKRLLDDVNFTSTALRSLDENIFEVTLENINTRFSDLRIKSQLLQGVGNTMHKLGLFDQAMVPKADALEIRRQHLPQDDPDTLTSMAQFAGLLAARFKFKEAEPYARESLDGRLRALGEQHRDTLTSMNLMGYVLQRQSRFAEAETWYQKALDGRRRLLGPDDPETLYSRYRMGQLYLFWDKPVDAEQHLVEAFKRSDHTYGPDDEVAVQTSIAIATLCRRYGRLDEAESLWNDALERLRRSRGAEFRDTLFVQCKLADLLMRRGKLDDAEMQVQDLARLRRQILTEDHFDTLESDRMVAELLRLQGRQDEAEVRYRQSFESHKRFAGVAHPETLHCATEYVALLDLMHRSDEAIVVRSECVHAVLEGLQQWRGEGVYPSLTPSFFELLVAMSDSAGLMREYAAIHRAKFGATHSSTLRALDDLARFLWRKGRLADAQPLAQEALDGFRDTLASPDNDMARCLDTLASILRDAGQLERALPLFEEAKQVRSSLDLPPRDYPECIRHADCLIRMHRFADAERVLLPCLEALPSDTMWGQYGQQLMIKAVIRLHDAWHAAEPAGGHDADATRWKARLSALDQEIAAHSFR